MSEQNNNTEWGVKPSLSPVPDYNYRGENHEDHQPPEVTHQNTGIKGQKGS